MSESTNPSNGLLTTPLHELHLELGAKMVPFAGYDMPISYGSIIDEHKWCRASAGFFDVSHMGRLRFSGRHARALRRCASTEDGRKTIGTRSMAHVR